MISTRLTFLLIASLSLFLTSCRKEKAVNGYKSKHFFYAIDHSRILYDIIPQTSIESLWRQKYIELPADAASFEVLSSDFAKDKKHIFYTYKVVMNVDYATFYWDSINEIPKDKHHVYLPETETDYLTVIKYADPKTYARVALPVKGLKWFKDKRYYYYNHEKTQADIETMRFDSPYLPFDRQYIFYIKGEDIQPIIYKGQITVANERTVYDQQHLLYTAPNDSATLMVTYRDIKTLHFYDNKYNAFSIDSAVYVLGTKINDNNVDVQSFEIVDYPYYKDKNQVYYINTPLYGSDPQNFIILDSRFAKDSKHVYSRGRILPGYSPSKFNADKWGRYPTDFNYGKDPEKD